MMRKMCSEHKNIRREEKKIKEKGDPYMFHIHTYTVGQKYV